MGLGQRNGVAGALHRVLANGAPGDLRRPRHHLDTSIRRLDRPNIRLQSCMYAADLLVS
jgi:hypothetical protein